MSPNISRTIKRTEMKKEQKCLNVYEKESGLIFFYIYIEGPIILFFFLNFILPYPLNVNPEKVRRNKRIFP